MKTDNETAPARIPGIPASAMPGYISFVFLALVGPFFYAFFGYLFATASSNDASFKPIENISYVYVVWLIIFLAFILRPAVNGRTGGIQLTRLVGFISLGLYGAAFAACLTMLARGTDAQRFLSYIFFGLPLVPFIPAAYFLARALADQPWFNPNATPDEIGPSLGSIANINRQAGMGLSGRLSQEDLAAALAAPAPPPRWLCYIAPPIATAKLRRWRLTWLFGIICIAALAACIAIPLRALIGYLIIGGFADRLRGIAALRHAQAAAQHGKSTVHHRKPT